MTWSGLLQGWLTFLEAFLTVEISGLGGLMLHEGTYTWPTYPALAFVSAGAVLAGLRRVQALFGPSPH